MVKPGGFKRRVQAVGNNEENSHSNTTPPSKLPLASHPAQANSVNVNPAPRMPKKGAAEPETNYAIRFNIREKKLSRYVKPINCGVLGRRFIHE